MNRAYHTPHGQSEQGIHPQHLQAPDGTRLQELIQHASFASPGSRSLGMAGVPAFMRRARALEETLEHFWLSIAHAYEAERGQARDVWDFSMRWKRFLGAVDFGSLQRVVHDFNHYFPVEANLTLDPSSGGYLLHGQPFRPVRCPDAQQVLRHFPAHAEDHLMNIPRWHHREL